MEKQNKQFKIIRKIRRVEFWYEGEFYVYELRTEGGNEFAFIWKNGTERIYGPYLSHQTDEGREIFGVLEKKNFSQLKVKI
jgi:hypothetical protein